MATSKAAIVDRVKTGLAIIFAIFVLSLLCVVDLAYLTFKDRIITKNWPTVEAIVIPIQCSRRNSKTYPNENCRYSLNYVVQQDIYQTEQSLSKELATQYRDQRARTTTSFTTLIKVDPANPSNAFLAESGRKTWDLMILTDVLPITSSLLLIAYIIYRANKKNSA